MQSIYAARKVPMRTFVMGVLCLLPGLAHAEGPLRCAVSETQGTPDVRTPIDGDENFTHVTPGTRGGPVIKCAVTADKVTIGKVVINRGNCQSANDAMADVFKKLRQGLGTAGVPPELLVPNDTAGEHHFGDTIVIAPMCASVLEFSIEVDGEAITFTNPD
jgi:hypothetical protein